ncbi:hypothetical protein [Vibrio sp. CJQ_6]|uniref:hypothetical protein n=1 Tax=Vibrio sp. CJQ_6 TaxID=3367165 RepID=UPI00370BD7FB
MKYVVLSLLLPLMLLSGCANDPRLGTHVAQVKQLQTYNPNATKENLEVLPDGTGERMEGVYNTYTGKKGEELKGGSTSQILEGFK